MEFFYREDFLRRPMRELAFIIFEKECNED